MRLEGGKHAETRKEVLKEDVRNGLCLLVSGGKGLYPSRECVNPQDQEILEMLYGGHIGEVNLPVTGR